jgi:hypothetical protein
MKNLIVALSLLLGVTVSAQIKKQQAPKAVVSSIKSTASNPEEAGTKDIISLESFVALTAEKRAMLQELFTTKHRMYNDIGGQSIERDKMVAESIASKLESSLDSPTYDKIKRNKALFTKLVGK